VKQNRSQSASSPASSHDGGHHSDRAVLSHAKVNLFLKILGKRPDGYHDILSVVDIISLCDVLRIKEIPEDAVTATDDKGILPEGEANTMYRAAMVLKRRYNIAAGVKVFVEKNIPIGSGLGGPSSNAATVLAELIRIWGLTVSDYELNEMGKSIGADVPLFLYGKPCVMSGIGERIEPISLPFLWYLIVYPNVVMRTREVYENLRIELTNKENHSTLRQNFDVPEDVSRLLENDLERPGIAMCPIIQTVKDRLKGAGAVGALMSGSGSSVFGVFPNERAASEASTELNDMGSVFVASSYRTGRLDGYGHQEFPR
jgi:4-diphosphocytidyl-2-C-methyl-D-erythritol kinase